MHLTAFLASPVKTIVLSCMGHRHRHRHRLERASERAIDTTHRLLRRPKKTENTTVTVTVVGYALVERRRRRGRLSYARRIRGRKERLWQLGLGLFFPLLQRILAFRSCRPAGQPVMWSTAERRAQSSRPHRQSTVDSRQCKDQIYTVRWPDLVATMIPRTTRLSPFGGLPN